jgi:cytochrome c-type biogenesis protein
MTESVTLIGAFLAGILSFVSPCVLPIVPGYLSFISGINVARMKDGAPDPGLVRRVAVTSCFFVLGFSTVFVTLGAAATLVGYYLQQWKRPLGMLGGVIVLILGLHTLGVFRLNFLLYEKRAEVQTKPLGLVGAYVVGLAFAFGWTPCIGPILGTILLYAAQQSTVAQGILLLTAYSAGLGVPFLAAALAINGFFSASSSLRRHMKAVEVVSGVLLIGVGVLLMTDQLSVLARYLSRVFPALQRIG